MFIFFLLGDNLIILLFLKIEKDKYTLGNPSRPYNKTKIPTLERLIVFRSLIVILLYQL
jgi:hypothetical protein